MIIQHCEIAKKKSRGKGKKKKKERLICERNLIIIYLIEETRITIGLQAISDRVRISIQGGQD